jgi:protein SMG6
VLALFSIESQRRRALPDATSKDLFILLHGMLFTRIELDEFAPTMERFLERLSLDNAYQENTNPDASFWEERDWIIMGVINIASMLEYGKTVGCIKAAMNANQAISSTTESQKEPDVGMLVQRSQSLTVDDHETQHMDVDEAAANRSREESQQMSAEEDEPLTFRMALQLTFSVLSHAIRQPLRKATPFARPSLNPYIDIILTFLSATLRRTRNVELMQRSIPWQEFADFLNTAPHQLQTSEVEGGFRITQGCQPLPEDWCLRGMEWVARRTYERGFWKADAGLGGEQPVLNSEEVVGNATDGIIEDDDDEDTNPHRRERGENTKRWIRILRASLSISRAVEGFLWDKDTRMWIVTGQLAKKVADWAEEERRRVSEDQWRREKHWNREDNLSDLSDEGDDIENDDDDDDAEDTEEVKALKVSSLV